MGVAVELSVLRQVHLPHPARAEQSDDLVATESGAGGEGHQSLYVGLKLVFGPTRHEVREAAEVLGTLDPRPHPGVCSPESRVLEVQVRFIGHLAEVGGHQVETSGLVTGSQDCINSR